MARRISLAAMGFIVVASLSLAAEPEGGKTNISFKKFTLDTKFRSEGVCVGDFNHDGKLDIAAGSVYYAAPNWEMHVIDPEGKVYDPKVYSNSLCNYSEDIKGDCMTALLMVVIPGKASSRRR